MEKQSRTVRTVAILFLFVTTFGFVAAVVGLFAWSSPSPNDRFSEAESSFVAGLLDGSISARVETATDAGMPFRTPAIHVMAAIRYLLFRSGNDGVVIGREGWLFTREEFEYHDTDESALYERLGFIRAVGDRLAEIDVTLLVVLVPSKARIVTDPLPRRWAVLAAHPRYDAAIRQFELDRIAAVDLRPPLRELSEAFLRTDTHWSPQGARHAAQAVAAASVGLGVTSRVTRSEFSTVGAEEIEVAGDLASFLAVGAFGPILGFPGQIVTRRETVEVSAGSLGLFDAPTIPVTLVGTSYSADARWNFVGELKEALASDVLNISTEAVGPFVPMAEYLDSSAFSEVRPVLVVWEIPERYLTLPGIDLPKL